MQGLRPRKANQKDANAIETLTRAAYAMWVPVIGREPLPMTADHSKAVADHIVNLWEDEGRLLGLVECIARDDHLLIENIAVEPGYQGRGLGQQMLQHAENLARSLGFAEIRLYTNAAFASNLEFYGRHGYVETLREVMVPGSITVHMSKAVNDS